MEQQHQPQLEPELFCPPALWFPGQNQEEWENEVRLHLFRAFARQDLLEGRIDPETYLDILDSQEYDAELLLEDWEIQLGM